jgi:hypothetical protein
MAYSRETIEFANKVVFRLMEVLKVCPNVDDKYHCWTINEKKHQRCKDLTWLLAEITNLPEYVEYLKENAEADPYGWIIKYPDGSGKISENS